MHKNERDYERIELLLKDLVKHTKVAISEREKENNAFFAAEQADARASDVVTELRNYFDGDDEEFQDLDSKIGFNVSGHVVGLRRDIETDRIEFDVIKVQADVKEGPVSRGNSRKSKK